MTESGIHAKPSKRLFVDHISKVFPEARKERKTGNTNSKVTIYHGIRLLPLQTSKPMKLGNIADIKQFIPTNIAIVHETNNSVKCCVPTLCSSNGNNIVKIITFFDSGEWEMEVSGKKIELEKIYISKTFSCDKNGIEAVFSAVEKITVCTGVEVTKNVIMTRFHMLETWKSDELEGKRLRSVVCSRVVPFNTVHRTCLKCQRMTFETSTPKGTFDTGNTPREITKPDTPTTDKNSGLSKGDIKKMIPGATDETAELIFNQAQNANRDPRGRRWTPGMIQACLQWFCRSPQSYEAFRASKYLLLPSRSTLIQFKSRVKQEVGFDENMLSWMHDEAKRRNLPAEGYTGGIIIDEMSIQSDIQICKNGDIIELVGFTDLGEEGNISHIMRKGRNEKQLGTHALQLVFLGVTGFRFPIAHFISDGVQAPELHPLFWEAVDLLRMYGFNVVYNCMDGAQSNRNFMHLNIRSSNSYIGNSPCTFSKVIFMMDSKHVIKKIRNNILKSGISNKCTRNLTLPNSDTIQWQMFIDCYKWDKSNALQLHRKLTNEHLYPSNQTKMRNHLAEDILDSDMLHLMKQYQQYLGEKGSVLNGSVELLTNTSKLIQIFKDMRPVKTAEDPRLQELLAVAQWFDNWKVTMLNSDSLPVKERGKKIMSIQCHEDIQSCIIGFCELCHILLSDSSTVYITPGLINSDVVENLFNQQRSTYHGANSNPNALQYRRALNSIVLCQTTVSQKANAGKNREAALPYGFSMKNQVSSTKRKSLDSSYSKIKVIRM